MARAMLYALLICSDEACAEELEAWGELEDFDAMLCEGCGCTLQALAFSEVSLGTIVAFPARRPKLGWMPLRRGDRAA